MSMSQRPSRNGSHRAHRESSRRRRRDLETGGYSGLPPSSSSRRRSRDSPRPRRPRDADEEMVPGEEFRRKKTLVKPERNPANPDYPNYNYRQESHDMPTDPSATENESALEDDLDAETSSLRAMEHRRTDDSDVDYEPINHRPMEHASSQPRSHKRRPPRRISKRRSRAAQRRQKQVEPARPPSLWSVYCGFLTFWAPDFILRCFRMPAKEQRTAWREKMGLIGVILLVAAFVGFLTFGFTATVCGTPPTRLKSNQVTTNYMVFHGKAYDLTTFKHPAAAGIPSGKNVLYDLPHKYGGQDGSFFFQNVNGACKNLITLAPDSDVPTNSNGDLAWYFPCRAVNQDGSSKPNFTEPFYPGWACHTSGKARKTFLNMKSHGDVYYNWDDIKNKSRNLAVYSGEVVDFDLLRWFNTSQVSYPSKFDELRKNSNVRGADLTYYFQTGTEKKIGRCLTEIAKVGSIDGDTVGCIASKVVLYVSLVFILGIVIVKFGFALVFGWFMSRQFAPPKPSMTSDRKSRNQQIEDWSNDIYRPGPRLMEPAVAPDRTSKRASFLPTTSRFSSPYVIGSGGKRKPQYITMTTQNSTTNLITSGTASSRRPSRDGNEGSLSASVSRGSRSVRESSFEGIVGPAEFNADCVIPQPPPEWQPFGFPLAHSLCLVTCYSEGEEGIRTTLDSIAMTDYPNSHKTIIVICDGIIKGKGEEFSTPEIVLRMMHDHVVHPDDARSFSYVAVASGSKRHNMAKVYAGFYDFGENSVVPSEKRQRVPMILVSKCGTQAEANAAKPGNRGKRDSQIILMSFLQKVMFDERMTELEYEMFNGFWNVTGLPPDFYEMILMVDADTKVFPDSMTHMICAMVKDPEIMGLCGETKIANKTQSWVTMIQVFEYFISHHQAKAFESVFGGVTCLPGCFSMYRIKAPKGGQNYWVPILANPDIVENYSENVVDTLHKKNLLLLGEDRYLSTLMLKTFPKRKQVFVPQAVCKTMAPDEFKVLLSQRRRWINSTVHNLFELVLVRDLCGTFCFSMQFVIFIELVGTLVLPAAIAFTFYVVIKSIVQKPVQVIPLVLLALILGLPGVLIVITANNKVYVLWMLIYLLALPIWNFILPTYSYWKFDDFSWGDTRKTVGGSKGGHDTAEGEFDSSKITMKRWRDFERERRQRMQPKWSQSNTTGQYPSEHDPYPKF